MTSPLPWHILLYYLLLIFVPNISETVANIFITISGLFIAHMGMDFTEYLNNYRLIMAAKLLKSSDESILMLAGSVVLTACLILIVFLKENMVFHRNLQKSIEAVESHS